jgi:hypothetical protein
MLYVRNACTVLWLIHLSSASGLGEATVKTLVEQGGNAVVSTLLFGNFTE